MANKILRMKKATRTDLITYASVTIIFLVLLLMNSQGMLSRSLKGQLVPICCYMSMAVSLNLVVGILGDLSLGHAGFMSVGAFSGAIAAMSLQSMPDVFRVIIAMLIGAIFAAIVGMIVGAPVLKLHGDYLAIVTLAFGEIIKDIINCLVVGVDKTGLKIRFDFAGKLTIDDLKLAEDGIAIIKGPQGTAGVDTIASFPIGYVLVMITLLVVLNLKRSRAGRAIMALRDNTIAAESIGINVTKYKLMAFVTSAALAGAAGGLFGLTQSSLQATKFNFNQSILILVFVVMGGLGNIWGSLISAAVLTILPEALREFADYRMLVYAIVLILIMIFTNNPVMVDLFSKLRPRFKSKGGTS